MEHFADCSPVVKEGIGYMQQICSASKSAMADLYLGLDVGDLCPDLFVLPHQTLVLAPQRTNLHLELEVEVPNVLGHVNAGFPKAGERRFGNRDFLNEF